MPIELIYTSAPEGLFSPGGGFRTVAATRGMGKTWIERLERLSGYVEAYKPDEPSAGMSPVAWSHWRFTVNARRLSVLSRVSSAAGEHTGRTNVIAHHVALEPEDAPPRGGPALALAEGPFRSEPWSGPPKHIETPPTLPSQDESRFDAPAWKSLTGDAGWAGVLAEAARRRQEIALVYPPGTDVLALFREALALLPPVERWDVTFATYAMTLPRESECLWRGYPAGSTRVAPPPGDRARRIDLTAPLGRAEGEMLVEAARAGTRPSEVGGAGQAAVPSTRTPAIEPAMFAVSASTEFVVLPERLELADARPGSSRVAMATAAPAMESRPEVEIDERDEIMGRIGLVVALLALVIAVFSLVRNADDRSRSSGPSPSVTAELSSIGGSSRRASAATPATSSVSLPGIDDLESIKTRARTIQEELDSFESRFADLRKRSSGSLDVLIGEIDGARSRFEKEKESIGRLTTDADEQRREFAAHSKTIATLAEDIALLRDRAAQLPQSLSITAAFVSDSTSRVQEEVNKTIERLRGQLENQIKRDKAPIRVEALGKMLETLSSATFDVVTGQEIYDFVFPKPSGERDRPKHEELSHTVQIDGERVFLPWELSATQLTWKLPSSERVSLVWQPEKKAWGFKHSMGKMDTPSRESAVKRPAIVLLVWNSDVLGFRRLMISEQKGGK